MQKAEKITGKNVPTIVDGYSTEFGNRISEAINRIGSLVLAGKVAGVTDEQLARWRDGYSKPNLYGIVRLAGAASLSVEWLATGEGQKVPSGSENEAQEVGLGIYGEDLTLIERLDIDAAAGAGAYFETENTLDFVAYQTSWLRQRGINPTATRLLNVKGDSMEPTIRDGDMALVDTSIQEIIDNAIYVIIVGQRLLIKRIHVLVSGALVLISDNNLYSPETVPANEVEFVRVAGRVMWFGRSI